MTTSPDRKFVVATWDPATPDLKVPVGKAGTIEAARKVLKGLLARADGWTLGILAAPDWTLVEATA